MNSSPLCRRFLQDERGEACESSLLFEPSPSRPEMRNGHPLPQEVLIVLVALGIFYGCVAKIF
jgi:hypothetical protein